MLFFWWLLAVVLFPVLFLPFLPLKFILQLNRNKPDDYLYVVLRFYFFKYKKRLPLKVCEDFLNQKMKRSAAKLTAVEADSRLDDFRLFYESFQDFNAFLTGRADLFRDTYWEKFELNLSFGTGSPADTGILTGVMWSVVSVMLSYYLPRLGIWRSNPKIGLNPDFKQKRFSLQLDCIFCLPFGHLIDIVVSLFYNKVINRLKNFSYRRR